VARAVVTEKVLDDGTLIIELHGELDIAVNDALRDMLVDTINRRRPARVVVTMRHVAFVDSTGLGALIAGYNAARDAGVTFEVREVAAFIEQQMRAAGVLDRLAPSRK